jgi:hypothetical protein
MTADKERASQMAIGTFVSVLYERNWYPARIVRMEGKTIVVRRTQNQGPVPEIIRANSDDVRVIAEKNFGNY